MWSVKLSGAFKPYDPAVSSAIEAEWQASAPTAQGNATRHGRASFIIRGDRYEIDFTRMEQHKVGEPVRRRAVQRSTLTPANVPSPDPLSEASSSAAATSSPAEATCSSTEATRSPAEVTRSVVEEIAGSGFGLGLICGPTGPGKTRLLDALVERGVVGAAERKELWPKYQPIVSYLAERRGGVPAAMDRLNTIGINSVPTWMLNFGALSNGQQARCSLALALDHRKQFDDFGGFVEPHTRRLLAAGMARIVSKSQLTNVVLASVDVELAAWMQPDWLVVLDEQGMPRLTRNVPPATAERRPAASISIRYRDDDYDRAGAAPAVDPDLSLAQRHGASAAASFSLVAGERPSSSTEVKTSVTIDQATVEACSVTGLETSAVDQRRWFPRRYVVPPQLTDEHALWTVAVVLGASGSGKSLALKAVKGSEKRPGRTHWPARESVASEIARLLGEGEGGVADAMERWLGLRQTASRRPHAQLSAGERYLADCAHAVAEARQVAAGGCVVIDEFTSVLDRRLAARACAGLRKLMHGFGVGRLKLVVATVHQDIVPFLRPELLVLTSHKLVHELSWTSAAPPPAPPGWGIGGACPFSRPQLHFELRTAPDHPKASAGGYVTTLWEAVFAEHHYKDSQLQSGATVDVLRLAGSGSLVGMVATINHFGSLDKRDTAAHEKSKTRREHRVVVLPSWQGLGIGPALSDLSGSLWTATPHGDAAKTDRPNWRYLSTTAHPRFGTYRNGNAAWSPTSTSGAGGKWSHEYVGAAHVGPQRRVPLAGSDNGKRARRDPSQTTLRSAPGLRAAAVSPKTPAPAPLPPKAPGGSAEFAISLD